MAKKASVPPAERITGMKQAEEHECQGREGHAPWGGQAQQGRHERSVEKEGQAQQGQTEHASSNHMHLPLNRGRCHHTLSGENAPAYHTASNSAFRPIVYSATL